MPPREKCPVLFFLLVLLVYLWNAFFKRLNETFFVII